MQKFEYVYASNSANGYDAQAILQSKLQILRQRDDLALIVKNYRAGSGDAKNEGQFYAPFMIQFNNGSRWIIFSTTSCRTDRIKGQQWDAFNLKRLDTSIEKAVLTYPDSVDGSDKSAFIKQKAKYDNGEEISLLDDIVSHEELIRQIEEKASKIFLGCDEESDSNELEIEDATVCDTPQNIDGESLPTSDKDCSFVSGGSRLATFDGDNLMSAAESTTDEGRAYDFKGRAFERDIMTILNNESYLSMLKSNEMGAGDIGYDCFRRILNAISASPSSIDRIEATSEKEKIGLLPSGGQPKTDVWARIFYLNGQADDFTFSCKRSTQNLVTVHQYTADSFADVLDRDNYLLRKSLRLFQFHANARDMADVDRANLQEQLCPLLPKLCKWVLGGYGGECANPIQCAKYLVVYNPNDAYFAVHSVEDYMKLLLARKPLAFGTPFG